MSNYQEKRNRHADKLSELLIENMRKRDSDPLSPEQEQALKEAGREVLKQSTPLFRLTGTIPLYFVIFYYVLWIGTERRNNAKAITMERRHEVSLLKNMLFLTFVVLCISSFFFVLFYFSSINLEELFSPSMVGGGP